MAIKRTDLDLDLKPFCDENGVLAQVTKTELDNALFVKQDTALAAGETAERVKKFFDFMPLHVFLPWVNEIVAVLNAKAALIDSNKTEAASAVQAAKTELSGLLNASKKELEDSIAQLCTVVDDTKQTATEAFEQANTADSAFSGFINGSYQETLAAIESLNQRLNALADSDDTTLDQLSEVVDYIKSNRGLIEAVTTAKIGFSDIIDHLQSNDSKKPLSAAQGKLLGDRMAKAESKISAQEKRLAEKVDVSRYQETFGAGTQSVRYTLRGSDAIMAVQHMGTLNGIMVSGETFVISAPKFTLPDDLVESERGVPIGALWKRGAVVDFQVSDDIIESVTVTGTEPLERERRWSLIGAQVISGGEGLDMTINSDRLTEQAEEIAVFFFNASVGSGRTATLTIADDTGRSLTVEPNVAKATEYTGLVRFKKEGCWFATGMKGASYSTQMTPLEPMEGSFQTLTVSMDTKDGDLTGLDVRIYARV